MGFAESKLKPFRFPNDFDQALSNGSISAFFEATPHTKLLLSKFCSKYMIVGPTLKANGTAFVFQKGSPLVVDVSRAVIHITADEKMMEIEQKWFGNRTCAGPDSIIASNSVTLKSFEGLFAITGGVTALCLVVFLVIHIYKNKDLQRIANSSSIIWSSIWVVCRHYDQKDVSSYPFSRSRNTQDQFQESYLEELPSSPGNSCSSGIKFHSQEKEKNSNDTTHPNLLEIEAAAVANQA